MRARGTWIRCISSAFPAYNRESQSQSRIARTGHGSREGAGPLCRLPLGKGRGPKAHLVVQDNAYPRPLLAPSLFHLGVLGIAGSDHVRPEAAAGGS